MTTYYSMSGKTLALPTKLLCHHPLLRRMSSNLLEINQQRYAIFLSECGSTYSRLAVHSACPPPPRTFNCKTSASQPGTSPAKFILWCKCYEILLLSKIFNSHCIQLLSKIFIDSDFCHNYLHTLYVFACLL